MEAENEALLWWFWTREDEGSGDEMREMKRVTREERESSGG